MTIVEIPFKTVLQEPTLKLGCVPHNKTILSLRIETDHEPKFSAIVLFYTPL